MIKIGNHYVMIDTAFLVAMVGIAVGTGLGIAIMWALGWPHA